MDRYDEYYASTPPAPPPKPGSHEVSRINTPIAIQSSLHAAPPLSDPSQQQQQQFPPQHPPTPSQQPPPPPPPPQTHSDLPEAAGSAGARGAPLGPAAQQARIARPSAAPDPGDQWLPTFLEDKPKQDIAEILSTQSLLSALTHAPSTAHPSLTTSTQSLQTCLSENIDLATHLLDLERRLANTRANTQALLLSTHALERQWRAKEGEVDHALQKFAPKSLYQQLAAGVIEQGNVCTALEESFLDGEGGGGGGGAGEAMGLGFGGRGGEAEQASEREVLDWVKRYREAKKGYYLRRERKERWDEGRVGGWR